MMYYKNITKKEVKEIKSLTLKHPKTWNAEDRIRLVSGLPIPKNYKLI